MTHDPALSGGSACFRELSRLVRTRNRIALREEEDGDAS